MLVAMSKIIVMWAASCISYELEYVYTLGLICCRKGMESWQYGSQNHRLCHKAWLKVYLHCLWWMWDQVSTLYNVCSVHRGATMSTSEDVQYIGEISWYMWGDAMSTSGGCSSTSGGYHEYIGRCSVHRGMFSTSGFSIEIQRIL